MNLFKKQDFQRCQAVWNMHILYGAQHKKQRTILEFFLVPSKTKEPPCSTKTELLHAISTDKFTTKWQRLEVHIATGCTISKFSSY